jgi:hypothetical protein
MIGPKKEPQRWFRTLSTVTRTNFAVMSDGFECRRAILSDCLEHQFEMVARPRNQFRYNSLTVPV